MRRYFTRSVFDVWLSLERSAIIRDFHFGFPALNSIQQSPRLRPTFAQRIAGNLTSTHTKRAVTLLFRRHLLRVLRHNCPGRPCCGGQRQSRQAPRRGKGTFRYISPPRDSIIRRLFARELRELPDPWVDRTILEQLLGSE